MSVQSKSEIIRGDGGRPLSTLGTTLFFKTLTKGAVTIDAGACSSISRPSPKRLILSSGDGFHLQVPCRGALLGRVEEEKLCSDPPLIGP